VEGQGRSAAKVTDWPRKAQAVILPVLVKPGGRSVALMDQLKTRLGSCIDAASAESDEGGIVVWRHQGLDSRVRAVT